MNIVARVSRMGVTDYMRDVDVDSVTAPQLLQELSPGPPRWRVWADTIEPQVFDELGEGISALQARLQRWQHQG